MNSPKGVASITMSGAIAPIGSTKEEQTHRLEQKSKRKKDESIPMWQICEVLVPFPVHVKKK